jgi:hypothetical protein
MLAITKNLLANITYNLLVITALTCVTSGCVTANFTKPIASFKSSTDTAASAVGTYFTGLNQFERVLYLDDRIYDPDLRIEATDSAGNPTPLIGQIFKADSIKARMDSLSLLGSYADGLAALAGNTAPQNFATASMALGTNLLSLDKTFTSLSHTSDPSAGGYIGPVSQIIGVVGEFYLEKSRDDKVADAITKGAPAVTNILNLLQSDLETVVAPLKATGLAQQLAEELAAYNNTKDVNGNVIDAKQQRRVMTVAERQAAIEQIGTAAEQYDLFISSNPTEAINGIREAYAALLKYAQSDKSPKNFAELMSSIQAFQTKAATIAAAVQQIQNVRIQ